MNQSQNSSSNQNTFQNGMTHEGDFTNNNGKYNYLILNIKYNCIYE